MAQAWLRVGAEVYVLRFAIRGGRTVRSVARAVVVQGEGSAVVVEYDDGTRGRIPRGFVHKHVWPDERSARAAASGVDVPRQEAPQAAALRRASPREIAGGTASRAGSASRTTEPVPSIVPTSSNPVARLEDPAPAPAGAQPLGSFIRFVEAGSRGLPAQRLSLATIDLGADETTLGTALRQALAFSLSQLSVEVKVQWGALYLYALARGVEQGGDTPAWQRELARVHWPWLERGAELWGRRAVAGGPEALALARDRVRLTDPPALEPPYEASIEVAERLPVLGHHRLAVWCSADGAPTEALAELELVVDASQGLRVRLADAPGRLRRDGGVLVPLEGEETEVFFVVVGPLPGTTTLTMRLVTGGRELASVMIEVPVMKRSTARRWRARDDD